MPMRSHISEEGVHDLVSVLEGENDIVRVVDPVTRRVLYWPAEESSDVDDPCRECNAVWGRRRRCANCTSLEALRHRQRRIMVHDWCEGCGRCRERCRQNAIEIVEGRARIDPERCVFCGYCARACPQFCIKVV